MKLASAVRELLPEDETALPDVAAQIRKVFESEILPHFAEEERQVIPKLAEIGRKDLADRTMAEHEELKRLIAALEQPSTEAIEAFAQALCAHVEFEEETCWEVLEKAGF